MNETCLAQCGTLSSGAWDRQPPSALHVWAAAAAGARCLELFPTVGHTGPNLAKIRNYLLPLYRSAVGEFQPVTPLTHGRERHVPRSGKNNRKSSEATEAGSRKPAATPPCTASPKQVAVLLLPPASLPRPPSFPCPPPPHAPAEGPSHHASIMHKPPLPRRSSKHDIACCHHRAAVLVAHCRPFATGAVLLEQRAARLRAAPAM